MADNRKWRHIPERPRGFYMQYLDRLIEKNRAKREANLEDEAREEKYWRDREKWHGEQQHSKKLHNHIPATAGTRRSSLARM